MKNKRIILAILLIIAIIAVAIFLSFYNPVKIQNRTITDNTKPFLIKISYPYISGLNDFNQKVKTIVDKEINDFKTNSLQNDEAVKQIDPADYAKYPRQYELDIGYDKGETDNKIVSVVFNVYNFEGGAHGDSYPIALNYNQKSKSEIKLADLFPNQKDYLQKISDYCIKNLTKQIATQFQINSLQLTSPNPAPASILDSTELDWIKEGAAPSQENYSIFLINKNNLVFYFSKYQVAPGAAGGFKVTMPR